MNRLIRGAERLASNEDKLSLPLRVVGQAIEHAKSMNRKQSWTSEDINRKENS